MSDIHVIIEKLGAKIDSLQADKKELLVMLKSIKEDYYNGSINQFLINNIDKIESLLQKHMQ